MNLVLTINNGILLIKNMLIRYEIPIDMMASKDGELLILPVYLRNLR